MSANSPKNIWIVNQYCGSPTIGMNYRSWYFANELQQNGHTVRIISGSWSHLMNKPPVVSSSFTEQEVDGIPFMWVKLSQYAASQSIGRVLVMLQFMWRLFFLPKSKLPKPDVILVSSLSPFPILNAWFWSRKYKCKLFFEVRDIWPLSLIEIGGVSKWHPLVLFIGWFEKFAYRNSDKVISLLPNAKDHMVSRGMQADKFVYIPNGVSMNDASEPLNQDTLQAIEHLPFIVGYAGALGAANAMEYFIEAATLIDDSDVHFVMVGEGQHKAILQQQAKDLNLENIHFLDGIPKAQVPALLERFDIAFMTLHPHSIYRFGISLNKMFDYMKSGKPILSAIEAGNDFVKEASCGISVAPGDAQLIANGISGLKRMDSTEKIAMGKRGQDFVQKNHTYAGLANKLEGLF